MDKRSASKGIRIERRRPQYFRNRLIADLLSVYHLKEQRCFRPQRFCNEDKKSSAEAHPPSSLRVEELVSNGPSTGPEHVNRTYLPVLSVQPWVAEVSLRPPSDARCSRAFERNARHT